MEGWIKLHRKFLNWQWYDNPAVKSVFLHLLLTANIEDNQWHGICVKRGQTVTSIEKLAKATGLTVRQVRTALNHLETTQSVTRKAYSKYTVLTVNNYDEYQETTQSSTKKRQTSDKQTTNNRQTNDNTIRIKEEKERKKEKELPPSPPKQKYAEFVSMTDEEYSSLVAKVGEDGAKRCIEILDNYKGSTGKTYQSDYRTILNWVVKRYEEEKEKEKGSALNGNFGNNRDADRDEPPPRFSIVF
ncbi:MAG: hypothetical protein NC253_12290 [Ruminococcus sp.]|nr:hypothetical protein [Ruminococcus sp.]MCM1380627.1 hypothetical protein [Muribaculaceae bacterium]MCM1478369.1 hypothetical protein [Muribaculaceae bacterium]